MRLFKFVEFKFRILDIIINVQSYYVQNKNVLEKLMKFLKGVNKKRVLVRYGYNDVQFWLISCLRIEYFVGIIDG